MELKEFIKETLVQITEGVLEAREVLKDKDVLINPTTDLDGKVVHTTGDSFRALQKVEFNVGVTTELKEGTKGGIGVLTGFFSMGHAENQEAINKGVNSLKFTIPISLPYTGKIAGSSSTFS